MLFPRKGIDAKGFAVSSLVADVLWLGYTKIALKSDNEKPIVTFVDGSAQGTSY